MSSKRLDQIKSARSLNDLVDIVSDIAYEFKNSNAIVKRIVSSLSAEIQMDMRDTTVQNVPAATKAEKFVAPKVSELQKHVDVINKLHDNAVDLDAVEAVIKQSFAGNKKQAAALASIKALKADIDNSLNDAFEALSNIAEKHLPKVLSTLIDKVEEHLLDVVKATSYKDMTEYTFVVPDPEDKMSLHFCEYRAFENFKDSTGFVYPMYFFVVTGVIDKTGNMRFFVNCFPDFKRPGTYPLGAEVKDATSANKRIDMLLSHNKFAIDHLKQPMPFDTERAKTMGLPTIKGVKGVLVKNDDLLVKYDSKMSEAAKKNMVVDIIARLSAVLGLTKIGKQKNAKVFTYQNITISGAPALKFILVPNADKNDLHFSLQQLEETAEALGLNDKQKTALRFALQN